MLKLGRVAQFKMLFLVLVFVFNFDLFKFSAAILEKGLLSSRFTDTGYQPTVYFHCHSYMIIADIVLCSNNTELC